MRAIRIEENDKPYSADFADRLVELAREEDTTTRDTDGDEIFWVVFPDDPKRVWDFTEKALRSSLC